MKSANEETFRLRIRLTGKKVEGTLWKNNKCVFSYIGDCWVSCQLLRKKKMDRYPFPVGQGKLSEVCKTMYAIEKPWWLKRKILPQVSPAFNLLLWPIEGSFLRARLFVSQLSRTDFISWVISIKLAKKEELRQCFLSKGQEALLVQSPFSSGLSTWKRERWPVPKKHLKNNCDTAASFLNPERFKRHAALKNHRFFCLTKMFLLPCERYPLFEVLSIFNMEAESTIPQQKTQQRSQFPARNQSLSLFIRLFVLCANPVYQCMKPFLIQKWR